MISRENPGLRDRSERAGDCASVIAAAARDDAGATVERDCASIRRRGFM
jgi:hypothetical protein